MLELIELNKENIPHIEVIAINRKNDALVGYISEYHNGTFDCESDESTLKDVTHYIFIPKIH